MTATKPNPQAIIKAQMERLKAYQSFDLETKEEELETARTALKKAQDKVSALAKEITDYKLTIGMEGETTSTGPLSNDELVAKLNEIMSRFPNGANGKEIADVIGVYGVTGETISKFYYSDNQSTLKRIGVGLQTKYYLATAADLDAINTAKEKEKAAKEAKAKAHAAKAGK